MKRVRMHCNSCTGTEGGLISALWQTPQLHIALLCSLYCIHPALTTLPQECMTQLPALERSHPS